MTDLTRIAAIADLRAAARRRLPRSVFEFIDGGAGDEITRWANERDFDQITLAQRVGVDVSNRDLTTEILGVRSALPLIMAPTGLSGFFWPGGEVATARAARAMGVPYVLSTNSVASLEEVADAVGDSERWFQLYFLKDAALMSGMLSRAKDHGYRVLCLTLDLAVQGKRDRDVRNGFTVPLKPRFDTVLDMALHPAWSLGALRSNIRFGNFQGASAGSFSSIAQHVASLQDSSGDWAKVEAIIAEWGGPVVIKGVQDPDDAARCVEVGAEAIIVSNHGGRQLDGASSAIRALPGVVDAVAGQAQIILDGGVVRGTSILKAKALGADACMAGRGILWGVATKGEAGVRRALEIYRDEMSIAMALMGAPEFKAIGKSALCR